MNNNVAPLASLDSQVVDVAEPLVTLGMPTHNAERFVGPAVESILTQDYANIEIVINDNASTDATFDICRDYARRDPRIRLTRWTTDRGAAANFGMVLEQASGEYFAWTADHDLWAPNFVSRCLEALAADPLAVLAYGETMLIDREGKPIGVMPDGPDLTELPAVKRYRRAIWELEKCNMVYGLTITNALRACGPPPAIASSDHLVLARLALLGRILHIDETLFLRRENREQETPEQQRIGSLARILGGDTVLTDITVQRSYRVLRDLHLEAVRSSNMSPADKLAATASTLHCFDVRWGVPTPFIRQAAKLLYASRLMCRWVAAPFRRTGRRPMSD